MIDFQGLLAILDAAEKEPNIDMKHWKGTNSCGTSHCMIGAFCHQNPKDEFKIQESTFLGTTEYKIAERFGITAYEAQWLFMYNPIIQHHSFCKNAMNLGKNAALARLRKFIYYKLHKQEMTLEEGRHVSGNEAVLVAHEKVSLNV